MYVCNVHMSYAWWYEDLVHRTCVIWWEGSSCIALWCLGALQINVDQSSAYHTTLNPSVNQTLLIHQSINSTHTCGNRRISHSKIVSHSPHVAAGCLGTTLPGRKCSHVWHPSTTRGPTMHRAEFHLLGGLRTAYWIHSVDLISPTCCHVVTVNVCWQTHNTTEPIH